MRERFGDSFPAVLDAARAGEGWAFERLFTWLSRPLGAHLRGVGLEDPDGSANEVFLRAFRSLHRFDGDEDHFRSWIFTIAHHLVVDERRRRDRRPKTAPMPDEGSEPGRPEPDAAENALVRLGDERIRRLLADLAPAQREVVLLRVVADLSIEETARAMGKRPNAIKALQHRAMQALRQRLAEEDVTP